MFRLWDTKNLKVFLKILIFSKLFLKTHLKFVVSSIFNQKLTFQFQNYSDSWYKTIRRNFALIVKKCPLGFSDKLHPRVSQSTQNFKQFLPNKF